MTKDTALGIVRAAMTLAGSYLVGHTIAGHLIDQNLWQLILGAIATIVSSVWGFTDKPATIEGLQSLVRQCFVAVAGVLLALGVITQQTVDSVLALLLALLPVIQSHTSKVKVKQINSGKLQVTDSGKVAPASPQFK